MMKLTRSVLQKLQFEADLPATIELKKLVSDSREVKKGSGFIAYDTANHNATDFVENALENKVSCIFIDEKHRAAIEAAGYEGTFCYSKDFNTSQQDLIQQFYQNPSKKIKCIGVTGTNGKTSITYALYQVGRALKEKTAYIGTLGARIGNEHIETGFTTPDLLQLNALLARAVKKQVKYCFIEASSHGLVQGRLAGIDWNGAIFTNLSEEHLDYHKDLNDYFNAKKILFEDILALPAKQIAATLLHTNSTYGEQMFQWLCSQKPEFNITSVAEDGQLQIQGIERDWQGFVADLVYEGKKYRLSTPFIGDFNIHNLASVFGMGLALKWKADDILKAISKLKAIDGRMQRIMGPQGRNVIVDYAHTPDALENALAALRELNPIRIICIFGCGGDRDRDKRPLMGRAASLGADFVIVTNDNPRSEDPQTIANEIKSGMENSSYIVVFDRERAIRVGLQILGMQEVLLIAGKGHEDYQIIADQRTHFNDIEKVEALLKEMQYAEA